MTYSSGGLIQAADYNSFVTSINTLWGTGSGISGYGQASTLSNATASVNVGSTEWAALVSRVNSMRQHQSGTTYSPTTPVSGGLISYLSDLSTTISTITTNKNLANANGTDSTTNLDYTTTTNGGWTTSYVREASVTFASGDAARYFFNAGGKIILSFSLTSGDNSKSTDWATLCTNSGSLILDYTNFTKSGGGGNSPSPYDSTTGYYDLLTSYTVMFKQFSTGSSATYYANNYLQVEAKTNGVQGANGDNGTVLTFKCSFVDAATDSTYPELAGNVDNVDEVHGTLRVSVTVRPPSSTYLTTESWGTPTVASVSSTATGTSTSATAATRSFVNNITTSPWNLDSNGNFVMNGSTAGYIQPSFDFKAWVYLWGAGGGGGYQNNGYYPAGGPGGFTYGLVTFKTGYTYYLRAGEAGRAGTTGDNGYPAGYGGRGIYGGAGGGLTGIWLNVEGFGSFIMAAGGGGGGGNAYDLNNSSGVAGGGGGGGGTSGDDAGGNPFGNRATGGKAAAVGTSSTGGSGGAYNGGWNGYNFQGGASGGRGGGGGGGYYGGGGGGWQSGNWDFPGGGGSGYYNATHVASAGTFLSRGGTYGGYYRIVSGQGVASYGNTAGVGGYQQQNGGAGRLVIL